MAEEPALPLDGLSDEVMRLVAAHVHRKRRVARGLLVASITTAIAGIVLDSVLQLLPHGVFFLFLWATAALFIASLVARQRADPVFSHAYLHALAARDHDPVSPDDTLS